MGHCLEIMLGLGDCEVAILPSKIDSFRAKCLSPSKHPAHLDTRMENQPMQPPFSLRANLHAHFSESHFGDDEFQKVQVFIHSQKHTGAKGICKKVN